MRRISNAEAYDKLTAAKCYIDTVNTADKNKVKKARQGTNPTTPASHIAYVAAELGLRAFADEQGTQEPPPDPPPPIRKDVHPPLAYSQGASGEPSARYNVHINCTQDGTEWVDRAGLRYDEGGRSKGGRATVHVDGLKTADMMDQNEAWEPYEWQGRTYPPYPDECYKL